MTNTDNGDIVVSMMITSERGNATGDTIRVNSWINDVNVNYPSVPLVSLKLFRSECMGILKLILP